MKRARRTPNPKDQIEAWLSEYRQPQFETPESLSAKLPARGSRKPNADEQAGDWGSASDED